MGPVGASPTFYLIMETEVVSETLGSIVLQWMMVKVQKLNGFECFLKFL